jgi:hypothetical protein
MGAGQLIPGKRQDILVTAICKDEDVPLEVRKAFVGMRISTMFSSEQLDGAAPPGSRTAYGEEVVEALEREGKHAEAQMLTKALKDNDPESKYNFLVFEDGTYKFIKD